MFILDTTNARRDLLAATNSVHQTNYNLSQAQFETPVLVDPSVTQITPSNPGQHPPRNSTVVIRSIDGLPYEFASTVRYNRIGMQQLPQGQSVQFAGDLLHSHDLIPLIKEQWGHTLTTDDLVGHSFDLSGGFPSSQLLVADAGSLALFGEILIELTGPTVSP